jgi:hypothetical protein
MGRASDAEGSGWSDYEILSASYASTTALGKRSYRRIAGLRDGDRNNEGEAKIGTDAGEEEEMQLELELECEATATAPGKRRRSTPPLYHRWWYTVWE